MYGIIAGVNTQADTMTITSFGPNEAGAAAAFFTTLADFSVSRADLHLATSSNHLSLTAQCGSLGRETTALEGHLRDAMAPFGHEVSVAPSYAVALIGAKITAADITAAQGAVKGKTLRMRRIELESLCAVELTVILEDAAAARRDLRQVANERDIDICLESLANRRQRLVCFDCDSTLIEGEVIEMLAAHAGKEEEVAAVTERAMRGELDFAESLRERVAVLEGLDASIIDEVARDIELSPGAKKAISTLRRLGHRTAVVSGGFIQVLEGLAKDLQLDYVRANTLEIRDGKLTGKVTGQIVDRQAKEDLLREFAADSGIAMESTVAVGDGANDIAMVTAAGLGIAFDAKPALREVADACITSRRLDAVLPMVGIAGD